MVDHFNKAGIAPDMGNIRRKIMNMLEIEIGGGNSSSCVFVEIEVFCAHC